MPFVALSAGLCVLSLWDAAPIAETPVPAAPGSVTTAPAIPHEPPIQEFDSPDGALIAWVAEDHGGVVLSITDKNKHELASEEHYPEDRPGGFRFKQGGWTPNSQFFVYSTAAWQHSDQQPSDMPMYVYLRHKKAFLDLGEEVAKHVGKVKPGKFWLDFPDVVELEVVDSKTHSDMMTDVQLARALANVKEMQGANDPKSERQQ